MSWKPLRSLAESESLLTAPGTVHEVETVFVDGRLQRVYKNLWPSLREFWLSAVSQYSDDTYVVYEDQRLTYSQVHARAVRAAGVFRDVFGIKKGDRVGICSRNCPDYLVAFWACHLIGAVSVLVNAWLPQEPLLHCLVNTQCKLVIFDPERADLMHSTIQKIQHTASEPVSFLVFDFKEHNNRVWEGIRSFGDSLNDYRVDGAGVVDTPIVVLPEDNATLIFTSGTTGLPKGVLSTQRQFLTNVYNVLVGGFRASIRRGEDTPKVQRTVPQKGTLVTVPLFHVTGSTSFSMMATMTGMKIILTRKWDVEEAVRYDKVFVLINVARVQQFLRLIKSENVSVAGGVPSMVTDLTLSSLVGHPLEGLLFGGAPAPATLVLRANKAFPTATMIQGYGLTETNSIAVSLAGEDYVARPSSTGRASPVNEIQIVSENKCVPAGVAGEVWLRGPNVMKCYWRDPEATNALITQDGWLKTGDVGYLDEEGFLYIKDRNIIIRGGENVDSVTVENALYDDPRILEAAAVGVPDERLGELVAAIVSIRPEFQGQITEDTLIAHAKTRLPKFAVPVMIIILDTTFERTPSGKILKGELRKIARSHWELRRRGGNGKAGREALANL
ncbi:Long-chain-fatty-acid--CoA ligase FadD13 [Psilocybe cubensis]|uniref:Long-chain-fatty-acid--CoA ligase FadD13 n=1 Tax=Psilocybe cubensis TaxID=181762 RepID=A0ACB8HCE9_PSICU|nr:Long-chain-fatty-acid--CoA ligase FadD13 [Psilocybe cubensis]KAH9485387.1 Long-chain-fatty-acid--CoA ligase FadD13 [Psilocybe cubensis]